MHRQIRGFISCVLLGVLFFSQGVWAWGERGHHKICEVATHLVKEPGLKEFMRARSEMMGHLCNIPDIYWKSLGPSAKIGDATHYIDPEALGFTVETAPTKLEDLIASFKTKGGKKLEEDDGATLRAGTKFGTLWWRADQFFQLAIASGKKIKELKHPHDKEEQNWENPYNSAVYGFFVPLGIMGHFLGDATMPYHNTQDHDGFGTGHGGIHAYYESESVNALSDDLAKQIYEKAMSLPAPSPSPSVVERLKKMSIQAYADRPLIEAKDPILSPSNKEQKKKARRKSPEEGAKAFSDLIVTELAHSAQNLAELWDEAYRQSGKPDLSGYRSYHYPLNPDFVPPTYLLKD